MKMDARTRVYSVTLKLEEGELWQFHFILANSIDYYEQRKDLREDEKKAYELAKSLLVKIAKVNNGFGVIDL